MPGKFFFIVSAIFLSLQVAAQLRTETFYIEHKGLDRTYELFVPKNFSSGKNYSLLIALHGGGGTARQLVRHTRGRYNALAAEKNFVVVYPDGIGKSWNDGARDTLATARKLRIDDVGFIEQVIDDVISKIQIDRKNIFVCGISNGGFMAQRLASEIPHKINAIGVVAANLSEVQSKKPFPKQPVSVIFINGTNDPLVPYNGGNVEVFNQKRGKVLSVENSIKMWRKINGCSIATPQKSFPDNNKKDNCTAVKTVFYNPQDAGLKVAAIKIKNGGHTWPGTNGLLPKRLVGNTCKDFNGCDEIWSFFESVKK